MKHTVVVAALFLSLIAGGCKNAPKDAAAEPASEHPSMAGHQMVNVTVGENGFEPSRIELKQGTPAMVTFKRTTEATCAKDVALPELNLKKSLPLNESVTIPIPTDQARTYNTQQSQSTARAMPGWHQRELALAIPWLVGRQGPRRGVLAARVLDPPFLALEGS